MNSRRDFLKNAALFSAAMGTSNVFTMPIQKAMEINADPGSTFQDAEHVVFLMQENRSFDHMFGKLKGVRGFNDNRTYRTPSKDKVWVQKDKNGKAYSPFHIDIHKTKVTWQGGLPHSWKDQTGARNNGKYDRWIPEKSAMTMGYYNRKDIPFYYDLADAFTICDHHFCSSLTGTTPNRLFFWTGTIKGNGNNNKIPVVNNYQAESRNNTYVDWKSFPELLEENNIDWRVYQNELWSAELPGEHVDNWLGNYGDNALEYLKNHHVRLSAYFRKNGDKKKNLSAAEVTRQYEQLSTHQKNLVDRAFTTNIDAPFDYLALETFHFTNDQGEKESITLPKNDIFYKFREDVKNDALPTVSWLVAPQHFSDHTSSPLYGTWYVSEALDILTENPEIWKKTIFILTYDENDGYFDHLPPFVPPNPNDSLSGKVSKGINTAMDYHQKDNSPLGLGYRVPMIVASPWSKGGYVNSQVFDHTSCLMFLEKFLSQKTGKKIYSDNISNWRRAISGDLTSIFRPYDGKKIEQPDPLERTKVVTAIQNAKNKPKQLLPDPLSEIQIKSINEDKQAIVLPEQEQGIRKACALPYRLFVDGELNNDKSGFELSFKAGKGEFGMKTLANGAAFTVYTLKGQQRKTEPIRNYAVAAGKELSDKWDLADFESKEYDLFVQGPNGFYRRFVGDQNDPSITVRLTYEKQGIFHNKLSGNIKLSFSNLGNENYLFKVYDNLSKKEKNVILTANQQKEISIDLAKSSGWYDINIISNNKSAFFKQYAGHVERDAISITTPI